MFYTLAYKPDKGCPAFIDGILKESFYPGIYDEGMSGSWYYAEPGVLLTALPKRLILITKDKGYDFDFRTALSGHIVSESFLKIFNEIKTSTWEVATLDIVNPKGEKVTDKQYYYIRQVMQEQEKPHIIDIEQSNINFRKNGEIKNIISLTIKEEVSLDFFKIFEISLLGYTFVSSRLADVLKNENLKGFELVSTEQVGAIKRA
ncbi:hypothetical protein KDX38_20610 [Pseudomonas sp. CDFA 602]|nr:hypothetical protein [Pseudomonas californiensis]MCD6001606.1 hypothetical protein [Pseudomonas californiensis]